MQRQTAYLAILLDVFTRSLRGWHLGLHLDTQLALTALDQAYARHVPTIHHSDQGIQYAATGYVQQLQARHVQISMCEVGEPTQNGYAERVIRTIKEEEVYLNEYRIWPMPGPTLGTSSPMCTRPSAFTRRWVI